MGHSDYFEFSEIMGPSEKVIAEQVVEEGCLLGGVSVLQETRGLVQHEGGQRILGHQP